MAAIARRCCQGNPSSSDSSKGEDNLSSILPALDENQMVDIVRTLETVCRKLGSSTCTVVRIGTTVPVVRTVDGVMSGELNEQRQDNIKDESIVRGLKVLQALNVLTIEEDASGDMIGEDFGVNVRLTVF
jgi:NADH:ubiquinone oxidoreductase subunit F (NADH-binding)